MFECHTRLSHQALHDIFLPPLMVARYFFTPTYGRSIFFLEFYTHTHQKSNGPPLNVSVEAMDYCLLFFNITAMNTD